jgi:hypothetical protein
MAVDLRTCKKGDKLLTSLGDTLTYVKATPEEEEYYDHVVEYPSGSRGTRTHDGYVYRNVRMPEFDHDIVEINP